jgi:segregation and condensation protein B
MRLFARVTTKRVLGVLMCASAVTAVFGSRVSGWVRPRVQGALAPFGDAGMWVLTAARSHVGRPGGPSPGEQENRALRAYVAELQGEIDALRRQIPEMARIYRQIPPGEFPYTLVPARVALLDSLPYGRSGLVNVGGSRGARRGSGVTTRRLITGLSKALDGELPVLTHEALVGRLTDTWKYGATLQLVTDAQFKIPAQIHRIVDPDNPRTITTDERGSARTETLRDGVALGRLYEVNRRLGLGRETMDVLAAVAYSQPVRLSDLDRTRRSSSADALRELIDRDLVEAFREAEAAAGPVFYRTTPRFLQVFGLASVAQLKGNNPPVDVTAEGDGAAIVVRDVRKIDNVLPGDVLRTSRTELLPVGVAVGIVREVRQDADNPSRVILRVEPIADLTMLRRVYIVVAAQGGARP